MNFLQKLKIDKTLLLAFVALGLVVILQGLFASSSDKSHEEPPSRESFEVDTMIPAGYLLIPLQLSNSESLASLSGAFSIVDLYAASEKGHKSFKVASAVKLLRAPLNPQQFAVLVPEEESAKIMNIEGPFFAALKNPQESARVLAKKVVKNPLVIHYGE
jgi:hypothetical protein